MEPLSRRFVKQLIDSRPFPEFVRVGKSTPPDSVVDPATHTRNELNSLGIDELDTGATVAVGVGSRGIASIDAVITATVEELRTRGYEPVIVPAMGSHGGATAEGQRSLLESLGIAEEHVGASIDASMDTTTIATVEIDDCLAPVHVANAVLEADGFLVVNRVKPHTNFTGEIESGLCKMLAVGLGKQPGANAFHSAALNSGYVKTIKAFVDIIRTKTPCYGGVAVIENSQEQVASISGVPANKLLEREPVLLRHAREQMALLPVDNLDLLVVDKIGKEISGTGMDTNVIGRYRVLNTSDPDCPDIDLIYVRGLSDETEGNGNGIGLADITRQQAVDQLRTAETYANAITSGSLERAKIPVVAPDDEMALSMALNVLGGYDPDTTRIAWIESTAELGELLVSRAVADELTRPILSRGRLQFEDGTAAVDLI